MTEYGCRFGTTGDVVRIQKYGKIIRIRAIFVTTAAPTDGKYFSFSLKRKDATAGSTGYLWIFRRVCRLAGAAYNVWETFETNDDVNIDVDKDDYFLCDFDMTGSGILWYDLVDVRSAKQRQFSDNLSGVHTSST